MSIRPLRLVVLKARAKKIKAMRPKKNGPVSYLLQGDALQTTAAAVAPSHCLLLPLHPPFYFVFYLVPVLPTPAPSSLRSGHFTSPRSSRPFWIWGEGRGGGTGVVVRFDVVSSQ
jgi:hypothetical protein